MPKINWTIPAPVIIAIIGQAAVFGWLGASWKDTEAWKGAEDA